MFLSSLTRPHRHNGPCAVGTCISSCTISWSNPKFDLVIHSSLCSSPLGVVVILDFLARSSGRRTVHKPSLVVYESGIVIEV
ncbi:hypothetical protein IEO21_08467 [Rhodonia placenta]|uniref:Uncharacterized protein n=1 Tax=Rhodonia placenta TaxID=104341 RepID=A0A8H7NWL4_9APHY|nr:hypothetical protein IEO21_08467 [Postia placenta]